MMGASGAPEVGARAECIERRCSRCSGAASAQGSTLRVKGPGVNIWRKYSASQDGPIAMHTK